MGNVETFTSVNSDTWDIHEQSPEYHPKFVARRWESQRSGMKNVATLVDDSLDALRRRMDLTGFTRVPKKRSKFVGGSAIVETWIRLRR